MNFQKMKYTKYLENKEYMNYRLTLENEMDLEYVEKGSYEHYFYNFNEKDGDEERIRVHLFKFYLFNSFSKEDFYYEADAISSDLECVSGSLLDYFTEYFNDEAIVILDESYLYVSTNSAKNKIKINIAFLNLFLEKLQKVGVKYIAFMSKALIRDIDFENRKKLFNLLLLNDFFPISKISKEDYIFLKHLG